ncbi:MAG: hypothetical protein KQH59_18130 [Desulfobulbaceae bacterium]|nr:hypothetical protein [Desulfobulbaceae bacterium]
MAALKSYSTPAVLPPLRDPLQQPIGAGFGGTTLPRINLLGLWDENGISSIGLSISDYLSIRSELRSIFFVDETTLRTVEAATTLALASEYLNNGWELCGSEAKGVALYEEDTDVSILARAYRYFGETYPVETSYWLDAEGNQIQDVNGNPIEVIA